MSVFVADEQGRPVDADRLMALARHVLSDRGVPADMELTVLCVEPDDIAALNTQHMGATGPTDVLAFPMDMPGEAMADEPGILGDVVLCPTVAADQAATQGKAESEEIDLLLVHGILHLLGHDHAEPDERAAMFGLTDRLLETFRAARTSGMTAGGADDAR